MKAIPLSYFTKIDPQSHNRHIKINKHLYSRKSYEQQVMLKMYAVSLIENRRRFYGKNFRLTGFKGQNHTKRLFSKVNGFLTFNISEE